MPPVRPDLPNPNPQPPPSPPNVVNPNVPAPNVAVQPAAGASESAAASGASASAASAPEVLLVTIDNESAAQQRPTSEQAENQNSQQQTNSNQNNQNNRDNKDDRRKDRIKGRKKENSNDYYYYYPEAPQGQGEGDPDDIFYDNQGRVDNQQTQPERVVEQQQQQQQPQQQQQAQNNPTDQRTEQVNQETRNICSAPSGNEVPFFIPVNAQTLATYGQLLPKNGSFYCQNNADLCVKDIFGRQWRPASADNLITIIPSTKCIDEGRHCAVFLFLIASRPSTTADMTSASESLRYLDMVEGGRFLPFSRHVYIPIQGFSCNSCAESYCRAQ
ncbi:unnamed protein product [Nippostrongylus brasiliensis]|uniref:Phospholipid scramblase n=1 Tax=Nippostrongylus brasiliensis TaxID=27835 RepID=A0A0N4Y7P6_NIPBR|nr:unnamed protein product [Nippostrongylus brasiliensis]